MEQVFDGAMVVSKVDSLASSTSAMRQHLGENARAVEKANSQLAVVAENQEVLAARIDDELNRFQLQMHSVSKSLKEAGTLSTAVAGFSSNVTDKLR